MPSGSTGGGGSEGRPVTPQRLMEMSWAFAPPLILEAAVRNRVFDVLDDGPKPLEEVAAATGASHRGLRAILHALVGFQLLSFDGRRFALAPESAAFLVSTKPGFRGGFLRHLVRHIVPNWLKLGDLARTGEPAESVNEQDTGGEFFRQFVEDLFPVNYDAAKALAEALAPDLARGGGQVNVLDIAAGSGVWGIALAEKAPQVQVTAVDWPAVTPVTLAVATRRGVGDRLRVVEGDILEADFGTGYRVATLGHILHSEGEARSRKLLRKVFAALEPGGTIAVAEFMPDDDRCGPPQPLIFAVNMLVETRDGDAYTFGDLAGWLRDAGFADVRKLPAPAPSPLVLARKPEK